MEKRPLILQQLLKKFGNKSKLAKAVGVSPALVTRWLTAPHQISFSKCLMLEELTNGEFDAKELYALRNGGFVTVDESEVLVIEQEQKDQEENEF